MNLATDPLLDAAAAYLRAIGIEPVVIGGMSIQHQPGERMHNHELVVRFTAALPTEIERAVLGASS